MASACPVFDSNLCKYTTERSKEATARVVLWREMGIVGSYTLESSYCGTDLGDKKVRKYLEFVASDQPMKYFREYNSKLLI